MRKVLLIICAVFLVHEVVAEAGFFGSGGFINGGFFVTSVVEDDPPPDPGLSNLESLNYGASNTTKSCEAADDVSFDWSTALTAAFWVKCADSATEAVGFGKANTGSSNREWFIERYYADGDKLAVFVSSDSTQNCKIYATSVSVCDDTWHHYAFTYASGTIKLYVDGVEDTTPTKEADNACSPLKNGTSPVALGALHVAGNPGVRWQGFIDEPAIWMATLSAAEVAAVYASGTPPDLEGLSTASSLISWWRMGDDASDDTTTLIDQKGSNTMTCTNLLAGDFSSDVP